MLVRTLGVITLSMVAPAVAAASCTLPSGQIAVGQWSVKVVSFSRNASSLISPPRGRVTMALTVLVRSTGKGGDNPATFLDLYLRPNGSRSYHATIIRGAAQAAKGLRGSASAQYTVAYPVATTDRSKPLTLLLTDRGALTKRVGVPICS